MDASDHSASVAAWRLKYAGREDSLEATWELAAIEEQRGNALFSSGETGCAVHYHASMRALIPQGARFDSGEENDRRMEAYTRISNKLYEVGPDGRARSYKPPVADPVTTEAKTERREAVNRARRLRTRTETELGRLHQGLGHHHHYELANMWSDAAKALANDYPAEATTACGWSVHFFELYNKEWTVHLPASRWDSDGILEINEVQTLKDSLSIRDTPPPPDWVRLLLEGDLRHAVDTLPPDPPPEEFQALAAILADARRYAGR